MAESIQVVAFEGGELRPLGSEIVPGEAVLALPLSRLVVKMVRVPEEADAVETASGILAAVSPFPDEPLTVSCETVRETEKGRVVLAAALPEGAADDIADALDAAKINVTRVDILSLGELRGLWSQLSDGRVGVRRLVLLKSVDCLSLFVLDDDQPSAVRAITSEGDLRREVMLSLLEAEDFGGAKPLAEIVVAGDVDASGLESFAPVRRIEAGEDRIALALKGVGIEKAVPMIDPPKLFDRAGEIQYGLGQGGFPGVNMRKKPHAALFFRVHALSSPFFRILRQYTIVLSSCRGLLFFPQDIRFSLSLYCKILCGFFKLCLPFL